MQGIQEYIRGSLNESLQSKYKQVFIDFKLDVALDISSNYKGHVPLIKDFTDRLLDSLDDKNNFTPALSALWYQLYLWFRKDEEMVPFGGIMDAVSKASRELNIDNDLLASHLPEDYDYGVEWEDIEDYIGHAKFNSGRQPVNTVRDFINHIIESL